MLPWIANAILATGSLLIIKKRRTGFLAFLSGNGLWALHAFVQGNVPLITVNLMFMALNIWGWRSWAK